MADLREDQIDFERVITDPEYRRHVIIYLNMQARTRDNTHGTAARASAHATLYRAEMSGRRALRRIG